MRIAFVTTEHPWPAHGGGRKRTLSQLETLRAMPEVEHVALFSLSQLHPVHLWDSPRHVPRMLRRRLISGVPYLVAKWDCSEMHRRLRHVRCDVAYLDHLGAAAYIDHFRGARIVLEEHNVEHEVMARWAARQRGLLRLAAEHEARLTRAYERDVLRAVDSVVTISARDARTCEALSNTPVRFVPMPAKVRPHADVRARRVAYVGNARWHPNAAGLAWFRSEVWPRITGAELEVASPGSSEAEIEALYDRSSVLVAPVLGGSGLSVKVLDALAAGIPIVTTPDGASGLGSSHALCVAADARGFAEHLNRLLVDADLRAALSAAGHAFVQAHHTQDITTAALRDALGLGVCNSPE